jgi:hypothetical protein
MQFFPLFYRLGAEDRLLIWISGEKDCVAVDAEGFIPSFENDACLRAYAHQKNYGLEDEEPILHDLDSVASWTKAPDARIDCSETLAAWNLFIDVARSVPTKGTAFERLDAELLNIYKKVFWGNNLPAVTPQGEKYIPTWSPEEVASLAKILIVGLDLFGSCTRPYSSE